MLKAIYIYPVKSLGGISLTEAELEPRGVKYDRRWILTDQNGKMLTQRTHPHMALFKTALADDGIIVSAPEDNADTILIPFNSFKEEKLRIHVWDTGGFAHAVSETLDQWFTAHLGFSARLWYMPDHSDRKLESSYTRYQGPMSFADGWPILVISEASLSALNEQLEEAVPMNRFRPNIVVAGEYPFQEDEWSQVQFGDVMIEGGKPCGRCVMVTVDQDTGKKGKEPLATMAAWRKGESGKVIFGWNMFSKKGGKIRVGDPIHQL